ncbi:hypothetical protein [Phenylobacterium sp.]|uniref:hypothetical protein n=1 Tax=Phenylobacterium sp. TaxID=1871053 RepID=UPI00271F6C6E|nr:hypothetical protein [Phenylobacterium sp.]MDO8379270.1 hypothetical protein [Phenylobacterium sp.]
MSEPKKTERPLGLMAKNVLMFVVAAAVAGVLVHLIKSQVFPRLPAPLAELVGARK